jgi:hypothetical protein
MGSSVEHHILKVLHEEVGDNWRGGKGNHEIILTNDYTSN